jgi:hypothetical protein
VRQARAIRVSSSGSAEEEPNPMRGTAGFGQWDREERDSEGEDEAKGGGAALFLTEQFRV